jgi:hypothetical protein
MRQDMKIALMEKHSPKLLETLDLGEVDVKIIKPNIFRKGKIIVKSDVLYKLEKKGKELLDKGHELIKSIFVSNIKYCVVLSYKTNDNSLHLKLKRMCEKFNSSENSPLTKDGKK